MHNRRIGIKLLYISAVLILLGVLGFVSYKHLLQNREIAELKRQAVLREQSENMNPDAEPEIPAASAETLTETTTEPTTMAAAPATEEESSENEESQAEGYRWPFKSKSE